MNGRKAPRRYDELENAFRITKEMIKATPRGERDTLVILAKSLKESPNSSSNNQDALLKQVRQKYKQYNRDIKKEIKNAKHLRKQLKRQEKSSLKVFNAYVMQKVRVAVEQKNENKGGCQKSIEELNVNLTHTHVSITPGKPSMAFELPRKQLKIMDITLTKHHQGKIDEIDEEVSTEDQVHLINQKKLVDLKMTQKQEERATEIRSQLIVGLEKQARDVAIRGLDCLKKEINAAETKDQIRVREKLQHVKDQIKKEENEAHERAKEIDILEKQAAQRALEVCDTLQREKVTEETFQEKEVRLRLMTMRENQILVDKEIKSNTNQIAAMEYEQDRLVKEETSDSCAKENNKKIKELDEELRVAKERQKEQEQKVIDMVKEIQNLEREQGNIALKEFISLREKGKFIDTKADQEIKSKLANLRLKQKQFKNDMKIKFRQIEKIE